MFIVFVYRMEGINGSSEGTGIGYNSFVEEYSSVLHAIPLPNSEEEVEEKKIMEEENSKGMNKVSAITDGNAKNNEKSIDSYSSSVDTERKLNKKKVLKGRETPFNINKWIILVVYMYIGLTTGLLHWGWAKGLRELLVKSGAYEWYCTPASIVLEQLELQNANVSGNDMPKCREQRIQIDDLWTFSYVSQFVCSLLGGYTLDAFGPKISAMLGILFKIIGWLLLSFSSQSCQTYIPALILLAGASDLAFLPLLSLVNIFPKSKKSLVISLMGAAKSASCAVPIVMYTLWNAKTNNNPSSDEINLFKLCIGYIFVGLGICSFIVVFLVPWAPYRMIEVPLNDNKEENTKKIENEQEEEKKKKCICMKLKIPNRIKEVEENNRQQELYPQKATTDLTDKDEENVEMHKNSNNCNISNNQNSSNNEEKKNYDENSSKPTEDVLIKVNEEMISTSSEHYLNLSPNSDCEVTSTSSPPIRVWRLFISLSYILIVIYFCISLLRNEFCVKTADKQMGELYSVWGEIIAPLRFIPCIAMGLLTDYLGVYFSLSFLNALGILMYLFATIPLKAFRYLNVCVAFVYTSFVLSSVYTYLAVTQPREHFGKLTGCASLCAGLFTLLSMGMIRAPLLSMNITILVVGVLLIFLVLYLYRIDKKKN